ncbi:MAG: hypothetical protein LKJ88_05655 [Bacilli bacterium]|jgi:hypothetical protein|nr:hypothetical protein [Bacilli bacterium]
MYDRLIYSEREIKAEEIVAALKKAYPEVKTSKVDELNTFSFETKNNYGYFFLQVREKNGSLKDYDVTEENLGDKISYFKDKEHVFCFEIDGSDPDFIDHVTDDILSTIPGAVIEGKNGKLYEKK